MTLGDMITNALRRANVIRNNAVATAEMNRDSIRLFNGLMSEYDADGVDLGDYPVTATTDTLDIEREHENAVEAIFALNLQKFHGLPIEDGLVDDATRANRFILRNLACKPDVDLSFAPQGRAVKPPSDIING